MNSKSHLYISLAKSAIRILSGTTSTLIICHGFYYANVFNSLYYIYYAIAIISIGLVFAEVLGIFEELFDKR